MTYEASNWEKIAVGHYRVGSQRDLESITTFTITNLQNVGEGWSFEVISKNAVVNGRVAVEFKVYNAAGALADAPAMDVEMKGPKAKTAIEAPAPDATIAPQSGEVAIEGTAPGVSIAGYDPATIQVGPDTYLALTSAWSVPPDDGEQITVAWLGNNEAAGVEQDICRSNLGRIRIYWDTSDRLNVLLKNTGNDNVVNIRTAAIGDPEVESLWLLSLDTAEQGSPSGYYLMRAKAGEAAVEVTASEFTFDPDTLDFTTNGFGIFAQENNGNDPVTGKFRYFYLRYNKFLNPSVAAQLETFWKDGAPVDPGDNGELPQGGADIFLTGSDWETNLGGLDDLPMVGSPSFVVVDAGGGGGGAGELVIAPQSGEVAIEGTVPALASQVYPNVRFNGTNSMMLLPQSFASPGVGAVRKMTFAFQGGFEGTGNAALMRNHFGRAQIRRLGSTGTVLWILRDVNNADLFRMESAALINPAAEGLLYGSVDLDGGSPDFYSMWHNGLEITQEREAFVTGVDIDLDRTLYALFGQDGGTQLFLGNCRYLWIDFETAIDFHDPVEHAKFFNNAVSPGVPVWVGDNGEIPKDSPPHLFFAGNQDSWNAGENKGTLDDFPMQGAGVVDVPDIEPPPQSGAWPPANYGEKKYSTYTWVDNPGNGVTQSDINRALDTPKIGRIILRAPMYRLMPAADALDTAYINAARDICLANGLDFGIQAQIHVFGSWQKDKFTCGLPHFCFTDPQYAYVNNAGDRQPQPFGLVPSRFADNLSLPDDYFAASYPSETAMFGTSDGQRVWQPMRWHPAIVQLLKNLLSMLADQYPGLAVLMLDESALKIEASGSDVTPGNIDNGGAYDEYTVDDYTATLVDVMGHLSAVCAPKGIAGIMGFNTLPGSGGSAGVAARLVADVFPVAAELPNLALGFPDLAPGYGVYDPNIYNAYRDSYDGPIICGFQNLSYSQQYTALTIGQQVAWGVDVANLGLHGLVPSPAVSGGDWDEMVAAIDANAPRDFP